MRTTPAKHARCVATEMRRTVQIRDCFSSARTTRVPTGFVTVEPTHCMLIWSVPVILRCARSVSGRTGYRRGSCRLSQGPKVARMRRTVNSKLQSVPGWSDMQNCDGSPDASLVRKKRGIRRSVSPTNKAGGFAQSRLLCILVLLLQHTQTNALIAGAMNAGGIQDTTFWI